MYIIHPVRGYLNDIGDIEKLGYNIPIHYSRYLKVKLRYPNMSNNVNGLINVASEIIYFWDTARFSLTHYFAANVRSDLFIGNHIRTDTPYHSIVSRVRIVPSDFS